MTPLGMTPRPTSALDWKLVSFLYILMRDHMTPGAVEGLMQSHVEHSKATRDDLFSNPWLLAHAENLAERLR